MGPNFELKTEPTATGYPESASVTEAYIETRSKRKKNIHS